MIRRIALPLSYTALLTENPMSDASTAIPQTVRHVLAQDLSNRQEVAGANDFMQSEAPIK